MNTTKSEETVAIFRCFHCNNIYFIYKAGYDKLVICRMCQRMNYPMAVEKL